MSNFPRWRFHKHHKPEGKIVHSQEENERLGHGWVDSPKHFEPEEPATADVNSEAGKMPIISGEELAELTKPEAPVEPEQPAKRRGRGKKAEA